LGTTVDDKSILGADKAVAAVKSNGVISLIVAYGPMPSLRRRKLKALYVKLLSLRFGVVAAIFTITLLFMRSPVRSESSKNKHGHVSRVDTILLGTLGLKCSDVSQLGDGEWRHARRGVFWQPKTCYLDYFGTRASAALLNSKSLLFVGGPIALGLFEETCLLADMQVVSAERAGKRCGPVVAYVPDLLSSDSIGINVSSVIFSPEHPTSPLRGCKMRREPASTVLVSSFKDIDRHRRCEWRRGFKTDWLLAKHLSSNALVDDACATKTYQLARMWLSSAENVVQSLRGTRKFIGKLLILTSPVNICLDRFTSDNRLLFQFNEMLRESKVLQHAGVGILDIERVVGTRPEVFHHEHSKHFRSQNDVASKSRCRFKQGEICPGNYVQFRKAASQVKSHSSQKTDRSSAVHKLVVQLVLNSLTHSDKRVQAGHSTRRFRTCALVSTAGYLLNYDSGARIDIADVVVRVAHGPTEGFETHVGSRTDVRLIKWASFDGRANNSVAFRDMLQAAQEKQVIFFDSLEDSSNPMFGLTDADYVLSQHIPYTAVFTSSWNAAVFKQRSAVFRCINAPQIDDRLTTGMLAFLFLTQKVQLCSKILLYGFQGNKHPTSQYHYFKLNFEDEDRRTNDHYESRSELHSFAKEQNCLRKYATYIDDDVLEFDLSHDTTS